MKTNQPTPEPNKIKAPLTKKKLAKLLGVSEFILRKWLKSIKDLIGEPIGLKYNINQVRLIVQKFGAMTDFEKSEHPKLLKEQMEYNKLLEQKAELIKNIKSDPTLKLGRFLK